MLGETPLPAAPRSVFDYLSQKDRDRLQAMASGIAGAAPPPPAVIVVPPLEPRLAQAALKGFQPFVSDPAKQGRYTEYLRSQVGGEEAEVLTLKPKPGQSNEAFNHELAEYANAARIFKPVSGAMASRFTSAAVVEAGPKAIEGLHQPSSFISEPAKSHGEEKLRLEDPPKALAAKAGMFGPLTRETDAWFPARLLCKRFGVPDPHPDGAAAEAAVQAKKDKQTQFEQETKRLAADAATASASAATADGEPAESGEGRKTDLSNVGLGEDETQGRDTLTYERPAMDIFKAIFASDDEDSGDEVDAPPTAQAADAQLAQETLVKQEPAPALVDEPVDLASFRPTFVSRVKREGKDATDLKPKEKKEKRDKNKKSAKFSLVSFGDDDGEALEGPAAPPGGDDEERKHKKKKKRREKPKVTREDDDDAMWVEKDVPITISTLEIPSVADGAPRGRKRAVDFL